MAYIIASSIGIKLNMHRFENMIEAIEAATKMTAHFEGTGIIFYIEAA